MDDDARVRHRRARRDEQPRHLLGDAGGGLRAPRRPRRPARRSPRALQAPSCCRPDGTRRQLSAGDCGARSPTATRSSTSRRWRRSPDAVDAGGRTSAASRSPTGAACAARWRSWSRSCGATGWPYPPDVMYNESGRCGRRSLLFAGRRSASRATSSCGEAAGRLEGRGSDPELLRPSAAALVRLNRRRSPSEEPLVMKHCPSASLVLSCVMAFAYPTASPRRRGGTPATASILVTLDGARTEEMFGGLDTDGAREHAQGGRRSSRPPRPTRASGRRRARSAGRS